MKPSKELTIRPSIIITASGKYCAGCPFIWAGQCQIFFYLLPSNKTGILRLKECLKAEVLTKKNI